MNISEPVEKSVLSAKAKDILLNKGIVTIGELFSAKGKQFSEIITEYSKGTGGIHPSECRTG